MIAIMNAHHALPKRTFLWPCIILIVLSGILLADPADVAAQSAGRGYVTSASDLDYIRQRSQQGVEPYRSIVADFLSSTGSPTSWSSGAAGTQFTVDGGDCISNTQTDRDRFVNQQGGAQETYRKALAYHLTRDIAYVHAARGRILELTNTGYYGGEEYSGDNECILHLARALPLWIQAADLLEGTSVWTAADRQRFSAWLVQTAYAKVAWASRIERNNWGSIGSLAASMIGDYVGSSTTLRETLPVSRQLTGAQAYSEHNAQQLQRLNTVWKGDSRCSVWGIRATGGIPDELRRGSTGCNGSYLLSSDSSYEYQIAQIDDLVFHAEYLRRRGNTSLYDNQAADGSGSLLKAIMFVISNPTRSWPWPSYKTGILHVAYRYYRSAVIGRAITTVDLERGATISFGQLTHPKDESAVAAGTATPTRVPATATRPPATATVTSTGPTPLPDQVRNGSFSNGLDNWTFTGDINRAVTSGVLNAYRTNSSSWGGITSNLTFNTRQGHTLEASFQLGNTSSVAKSVVIHLNSATGGFAGELACQYTVPARTPLTTYHFIGPVGAGWTGTGVAFQIVFSNADNQASLLVDNVHVYQQFQVTVPTLNCYVGGVGQAPTPTATTRPATATPTATATRPTASPTVAPTQVPNETRNGDFSNGLTNWTFTSDISWTNSSGVLNAYRMNASSWGSITNNMTFNARPGHTLEATFQLGNTSGTAKNVIVYLNSATGGLTGALVCPYTIPANTPLTSYRLIGPVGDGWTGTGVAFQVVFQAADNAPTLLLDNVNTYKYFTVTTPSLDCNVGGTPRQQPTSTATLPPATATLTVTRMPATATPTATSSATGTATPVPPTGTATMTATATSTATRPPASATPTATRIPPTATWTLTSLPPTATLTLTPVPPTAVPPSPVPTQVPDSTPPPSVQMMVEASLVLGNRSAERQQVTLLLGDVSRADVRSCEFSLEPNSLAQVYTLRTSLDMSWNEMEVMLETGSAGSGSWLDVSRVSMRHRFDQPQTETQCIGPEPYTSQTNISSTNSIAAAMPNDLALTEINELSAAAPASTAVASEPQVAALPIEATTDLAGQDIAALPTAVESVPLEPVVVALPLDGSELATVVFNAPLPALPPPVVSAMDDGASDWSGSVGWRLDAAAAWGGAGLGWSVMSTQPREVLTWNRWLDLSTVGQARLRFQSRLQSAGSLAGVEVSLDGVTWIPLASVASSTDWQPVELDLSSYAGWQVQVRFVWDSASPADQWAIDQVSIAEGEPALPPAPPPEDVPTPVPTLDVALPPDIAPTPDPAVGAIPAPGEDIMPTVFPPEMLPPLTVPAIAAMDDGAPDWLGPAGWRLDGAAAWNGSGLGWLVTSTQPREVLTWNRWLDLSTVGQARLEFQSRLQSAGSLAEVEVSLDGVNWILLASVAPGADWQSVALDLSPYAGQRVLVRFVWDADPASVTGVSTDAWSIDQVSIVDGTVAVPPTPSPVVTSPVEELTAPEVAPEVTPATDGP